ncbi:MAG: AMP-binding protein [Gammaproteobacteria bacterium]|jgi:fatty-acyl-CoA synthase|nr:AMP-binding protein [Gammaproteobacteria bacterium]
MDITLSGLLTRAINRHHTRTALISNGQVLSYAELDEQSDRLAAGMQQLGVGPGDRVALFLGNCPEYVIADIAILKIGAIKVPLNSYQSTADVSYILDATQARLLIADSNLLTNLEPIDLPDATKEVVVTLQDAVFQKEVAQWSWPNMLKKSAWKSPGISATDTAMITYTGGTTGRPKGVVQTQQSLGINLSAHIVAGEISADEVMLLTTPLPHSAGYHLQACLLQGGTVILQDGFNSTAFLEEVGNSHVTWSFLVPTMIYRLLDDPNIGGANLESLRTIVYGAAPMSTTRLTQAIEFFGPHLIQLYGQTECPNYITALTKEDHLNRRLRDSCGKAIPFTEVKIARNDELATGEVLVRSPYLLKEYYQNPSATRDTIQQGWLHTGDIGFIDEDGYLFLKDRAKDMIISGGMNVYTIEVEQVLKEHPAVRDAAVVGLPHPDWGEQVHAVVVVSEAIGAEKLVNHCRGKLSKYKLPKSVSFVTEMPLTAYGKTDKKALREDLND